MWTQNCMAGTGYTRISNLGSMIPCIIGRYRIESRKFVRPIAGSGFYSWIGTHGTRYSSTSRGLSRWAASYNSEHSKMWDRTHIDLNRRTWLPVIWNTWHIYSALHFDVIVENVFGWVYCNTLSRKAQFFIDWLSTCTWWMVGYFLPFTVHQA